MLQSIIIKESSAEYFKIGLTIFLYVSVSPSIDYISQNTTVNETDDVILFCNSTGNPSANITWKFLDNSTKVTFGEHLSLQRVNRSQAGTYRCTANNAGPSHAWAEVHVQVNCKSVAKHPVWRLSACSLTDVK